MTVPRGETVKVTGVPAAGTPYWSTIFTAMIAGILAHRAVRAAEQGDEIRCSARTYQEQIRNAQRYAGGLQRHRAGVRAGLGNGCRPEPR